MFPLRSRMAAIAAAAALACAGGAAAEPVHFDNPAPGEPGHADWLDLQFLNITMPASEQTGAKGGFDNFGTFEFRVEESFDPFTDPQGEIAGGIVAGFGGRVHVTGVQTLVLFQPGGIIGPGGAIPMGLGGPVFKDFFTDGVLVDSSLVGPLGEHFLGVRFATNHDGQIFTDFHFGYIGFNLFERADGTHGLYATRWGYETELDTAITIVPAPGAGLVMLAAGGLLTMRTRRTSARRRPVRCEK